MQPHATAGQACFHPFLDGAGLGFNLSETSNSNISYREIDNEIWVRRALAPEEA